MLYNMCVDHDVVLLQQAVASITVPRNLLAHANNVNMLLRILTHINKQGSRKPIDIKKLKALLDRMHTEMPVETKAEIQVTTNNSISKYN
jgi:hypothetical protein